MVQLLTPGFDRSTHITQVFMFFHGFLVQASCMLAVLLSIHLPGKPYLVLSYAALAVSRLPHLLLHYIAACADGKHSKRAVCQGLRQVALGTTSTSTVKIGGLECLVAVEIGFLDYKSGV